MVGADGTRVPLDGWVLPLPAEDEALASSFCNIDRRPTLTRHQFEAEYRCVCLYSLHDTVPRHDRRRVAHARMLHSPSPCAQ